MLIGRVAETNMPPTRTNFNKTGGARKVIDLSESGTRVCITRVPMVIGLGRVGPDVKIPHWAEESCAYAALYPEFQDENTLFTSSQ